MALRTVAVVVPGDPSIVVTGYLEVETPPQFVIDRIVKRYLAENVSPDGFRWGDLREIPTRYWEMAGWRMPTVMIAAVTVGRFDEWVVEPEERVLPTAPKKSPE